MKGGAASNDFTNLEGTTLSLVIPVDAGLTIGLSYRRGRSMLDRGDFLPTETSKYPSMGMLMCNKVEISCITGKKSVDGKIFGDVKIKFIEDKSGFHVEISRRWKVTEEGKYLYPVFDNNCGTTSPAVNNHVSSVLKYLDYLSKNGGGGDLPSNLANMKYAMMISNVLYSDEKIRESSDWFYLPDNYVNKKYLCEATVFNLQNLFAREFFSIGGALPNAGKGPSGSPTNTRGGASSSIPRASERLDGLTWPEVYKNTVVKATDFFETLYHQRPNGYLDTKVLAVGKYPDIDIGDGIPVKSSFFGSTENVVYATHGTPSKRTIDMSMREKIYTILLSTIEPYLSHNLVIALKEDVKDKTGSDTWVWNHNNNSLDTLESIKASPSLIEVLNTDWYTNKFAESAVAYPLGQGSYGTVLYNPEWKTMLSVSLAVKRLKLPDMPTDKSDTITLEKQCKKYEEIIVDAFKEYYVGQDVLVSANGVNGQRNHLRDDSYFTINHHLVFNKGWMPFLISTKSGQALDHLLYIERIGFSLRQISQILYDVLYGLSIMHSGRADTSCGQAIVHRDLKSPNILIRMFKKDNGKYNEVFKYDDDVITRAVITDFGLSRTVLIDRENGRCGADVMMTGCGSVIWMAPEILLGRVYDHRVDLFSLAMIVMELLTNKLPWDGYCHGHAVPFKVTAGERPEETLVTACQRRARTDKQASQPRARTDIPASLIDTLGNFVKKAWSQAEHSRGTAAGHIPILLEADPSILTISPAAMLDIGKPTVLQSEPTVSTIAPIVWGGHHDKVIDDMCYLDGAEPIVAKDTVNLDIVGSHVITKLIESGYIVSPLSQLSTTAASIDDSTSVNEAALRSGINAIAKKEPGFYSVKQRGIYMFNKFYIPKIRWVGKNEWILVPNLDELDPYNLIDSIYLDIFSQDLRNSLHKPILMTTQSAKLWTEHLPKNAPHKKYLIEALITTAIKLNPDVPLYICIEVGGPLGRQLVLQKRAGMTDRAPNYTNIANITTMYHNIINKLYNMPNYPGRRLLDIGTRLQVEKVNEFKSWNIDYWGLAYELNADHSRMIGSNSRIRGWVKLGDNKNSSDCCQQFYVSCDNSADVASPLATVNLDGSGLADGTSHGSE
jgi:serine/threonine protein kinase